MSTPLDKDLWERIKNNIKNSYKKRWNAYYSGLLVQRYKDQGGKFKNDSNKKVKPLKRWFQEKWRDVGNKEYPVYRPTVRVNKETPKILSEIDKSKLKKQIILKQKYKGRKNLPKF